MGFRKAVPALSAAMLVMAMPAFADAKSEIQAVYNKLTAGFKKGDTNQIMSLGTKDFVMIQYGQRMSGEQVMKEMQGMFASGMKINKMSMTVRSVKVKGNTALATTDAVSDMMMKMPDGKMHRLESTSVSKDTLVKTPQGWKFKIAQTVSEKAKMDGKPFDPASMMAPPKAKK